VPFDSDFASSDLIEGNYQIILSNVYLLIVIIRFVELVTLLHGMFALVFYLFIGWD
jgi:hypothetical protein